ncbi:MAG TPA: SIS domain-containing protein [Propionibacteriaceae bacterium]|nr:SIS domain-containing protein [Propionibacteriaceae bacterium]
MNRSVQLGELHCLLAHVTDHLAAARAMEAVLPRVHEVAVLLCERFATGGHVYSFGNGGSAADAQHFTGELIGHYKRSRRALPAVTLTTDPTVMTCIANDYDYAEVFARQISALARPGDVIAAFTTSGQSANVVAGLKAARRAGATTVLFGGCRGGPASKHADYALLSPADQTPRIQEMHTLMLHMISDHVDAWAANEHSAN